MLEVTIRHNPSGTTRVCQLDLEWYGSFIWEEGNFACDCNRAIFFNRQTGDDFAPETCGSDVMEVVSITQDGKFLYSDETGDADDESA